MLKKIKATWTVLFGAILGGIASACIQSNVNLGMYILLIFLILTVIGTIIVYFLKKIFESSKKVVRNVKFYNDLAEREENSLKYLGPPYTKGVMALSDSQKERVLNDLNKYKDESIHSTKQPNADIQFLTEMYNKEHPEFILNEDTVQDLLNGKRIDANNLKINNELDMKAYKKIASILNLNRMMELFIHLDVTVQPYSFDDIIMLNDFIETEHNPECSFMSKELENLRIELINNLKGFVTLTGYHSEVMTGSNNLYIKKNVYMCSDEWEKITQEILKFRNDIWRNYDEFVKIGRRKFDIEYSQIVQA